MPLHRSIVDALGVATLVLVILLCLAGVCCVSYVLYFRSKIRQGQLHALREFNALWIVRIILIVFAMLWGLAELLRLPMLRRKGGLFYSMDFEWQALLCRIYTISSLGFIEPCFFLTALFLVQGSVRDAPFTPRKKWNEKVIGFILICCLPVFLVQAFFVIVSPTLPFSHEYNDGKEVFGLPTYFTRSFIREVVDKQDEAICTYPLFSTLVLGFFGCIYNIFFLWQGCRMMALVINKRLQMRVCGLVSALGLLLPVHVLFLGISVVSTPGDAIFEVMAFMGFLTVLLCISVGEGILVVQPIADALAVRWVFDSMQPRNQSLDDIALDPYAVPLCVLGIEEDYNTVATRESLLVKSAATPGGGNVEEISVLVPAFGKDEFACEGNYASDRRVNPTSVARYAAAP